jgi:hypothetical protein
VLQITKTAFLITSNGLPEPNAVRLTNDNASARVAIYFSENVAIYCPIGVHHPKIPVLGHFVLAGSYDEKLAVTAFGAATQSFIFIISKEGESA